MTISLRVVSSIMYLVQSFQLSYVFDWSTIFWNIVLFLLRRERKHSLETFISGRMMMMMFTETHNILL